MFIFIVSATYLFNLVLRKSENTNIKVDKIKESAKYIEDKLNDRIKNIIKKEQRVEKYVNRAQKILNYSIVSYIGLSNVYIFFILSIVLAYISFDKFLGMLNNGVAAMILGVITFILPMELLSFEVSQRKNNLRNHLPNFFLTVLQLLEGTDDVIEALETCVGRLKNPLKMQVEEFLFNYNSGKDLNYCLNIFRSRTDNPILIKFADDIELNLRNGTSIKGSIEDNIIKSYNNQINYMERITENTGNIFGGIMIMGIYVYVIYMIDKVKPELIYILTNNVYGKIVVNLVLILMIASILLMKHAVSYKDSQ